MSVLQSWKIWVLLSAFCPLSSGFTPSSSTGPSSVRPTSYRIWRNPCFQPVLSTVVLDAAGKRKRRRRKDSKDRTTESAREPEPEPSQQPQLESTSNVENTIPAEEVTKDDLLQIKDVANFEFESDGPASIGKL